MSKDRLGVKLSSLAEETLPVFDRIEAAARQEISGDLGSDSLVSTNTFTSPAAAEALLRSLEGFRDSCGMLVDEPAIARVVVIHEEHGGESTYYICRGQPLLGDVGAQLVSYKAEVGRLASLPVGGSFLMPRRGRVRIVENAQLHPRKDHQGWDSKDTVLSQHELGTATAESLRELLRVFPETEDILSRLLAGEQSEDAGIREGRRRTVISRMSLRDQPVLDQFQDEIFRLSLTQQLFLVGAPGTGKTTTLIRRLAQKREPRFLMDDERDLVNDIGTEHSESWIMFTPTELLKLYLKEAFAREGVPASDQRIRTWSDYRHRFARDVVKLLRTGADSRGFVLNDNVNTLTLDTTRVLDHLYFAFDEYRKASFIDDLWSAAKLLAESDDHRARSLGVELNEDLSRIADLSYFETLGAIDLKHAARAGALETALKSEAEGIVLDTLQRQLAANEDLLDEISRFLAATEDGRGYVDGDLVQNSDDANDEEEEAQDSSVRGRQAAHRAYVRAARAQARSAVTGRRPSSARQRRLIGWLGGRLLSDVDQLALGHRLHMLEAVVHFVNLPRSYLEGYRRRYVEFRQQAQSVGEWFEPSGFGVSEIHSLEVDVLVLSILRSVREMIRVPGVLSSSGGAASLLRTIVKEYRNQVLVDEATDFSSVQLACMEALAHPALCSFFACGDFDQRLTNWGVRSKSELLGMLPNLQYREVQVAYRQSPELRRFSSALLRILGLSEYSSKYDAGVEAPGVSPVLLERTPTNEAPLWLADRIREIERYVRILPSIAVFVTSEDEVVSIAAALEAELSQQNIKVVPCVGGRAVGDDESVRVFNIQHIKGLEFEAAFFVGLDRFLESDPEAMNTLYVGATRAATYLGVTCEGMLPRVLEGLRAHFAHDWAMSDV